MIDNLYLPKNIHNDDDIIKNEEGLIFNPYNIINIKITLSEVQSILKTYGVNYKIEHNQVFHLK